MRGMLIGVLAMCSVAGCGGGADSSEEAEGEPAAGDEAEAAPDEPLAPTTTAEGVLQRLGRARHLDSSTFDAETNALMEPGGVDPLVGSTRAAIVERLGEPDAADFTSEGRAGWNIGRVEEARMGHPPILVVELDASGVVTAARVQGSM